MRYPSWFSTNVTCWPYGILSYTAAFRPCIPAHPSFVFTAGIGPPLPMSSIHHANLRTSPPHARKSAVKAGRPALLGVSRVSFKGSSRAKPCTDQAKGKEEDAVTEHYDGNDDDTMTTSFLQFCCKRMDAEHVTDYNSYMSLHSHTSSEDVDNDMFGSKPRTYVERARPTPRPKPTARIPPEAHEGKADLDPTEWKPKLTHRPTSDASNYLSQFHRTPPTRGSSPRRTTAMQAQSLNSIPMSAPSLSATPSASSTSSTDSVAGTPHDSVYRPMTIHRSGTSKSIDLVTPQILSSKPIPPRKRKDKVTLKPDEGHTLSEDLSYEKKWSPNHQYGHPRSGSLTALLGSVSLDDHKGGAL
ncbi:MAG: hypothetical protein Q9222_000573 [Ikaeria aurantiellina]